MSKNIQSWLKASVEEVDVNVQEGETLKKDLNDAGNADTGEVKTETPAVAEIPAATQETDHKVIDQGSQELTVAAEESVVATNGPSDSAPATGEATTVDEIEKQSGKTVSADDTAPEETNEVDGHKMTDGEDDLNVVKDDLSATVFVSQEGFMGGLVGFLAGGVTWVPFVGAGVHAAAKAKRLKLRDDIESIAKRIEKVRKGQLEEAKKLGLSVPKSEAGIDWVGVVKGALLGSFFGPFYGARQGSQLENLNKELKAKLNELEKEMDAANISVESYQEGDFTVISNEEASEEEQVPAEQVEEPKADVVAEGTAEDDVKEDVVEVAPSVEDAKHDLERLTGVRRSLEAYRELVESAIKAGDGLSNQTADALRIGFESLDESFVEDQLVASQEAFGVESSRLTHSAQTLDRIDSAIGNVNTVIEKIEALLV